MGNVRVIMQVSFSKDGAFLYTGARCDTAIMCWDIRQTSEVSSASLPASPSFADMQHFSWLPGSWALSHVATGQLLLVRSSLHICCCMHTYAHCMLGYANRETCPVWP